MSAQYISWRCIETTFEKYDKFHLEPLDKIMFEIYIHLRFPRFGTKVPKVVDKHTTYLEVKEMEGYGFQLVIFNILQWEALLRASLPKSRVRALEVGGSPSHEMISPTSWT